MEKEEKIEELCEVLININKYSWDDTLFLPKDKNWSLKSNCTVLNMDDLDDEEEIPIFAKQHGLIDTLNVQEIQDIVENALEQNPHSTAIELFDAFIFYFENDAFKSFELQ